MKRLETKPLKHWHRGVWIYGHMGGKDPQVRIILALWNGEAYPKFPFSSYLEQLKMTGISLVGHLPTCNDAIIGVEGVTSHDPRIMIQPISMSQLSMSQQIFEAFEAALSYCFADVQQMQNQAHEEKKMWYVIQTLGREEEKTADIIRKRVSSYYIEDCFIPKRERMKKYHGCWNKVEEILFPGYVFVISRQPEGLYRELQQIPKLTKILGRENEYFVALKVEEQRLIQEIGDKDHRTSLSKVTVTEGNRVQVVDGPLKGYMGNVIKVNLHKREVIVKVTFMGREIELFMGIEMVDSEEKEPLRKVV